MLINREIFKFNNVLGYIVDYIIKTTTVDLHVLIYISL